MHPEEEPDADWVAALAGCGLPRARRALVEAAHETRLYGHLAREHQREGRESYIEIDAPLELYAIVRLVRPRQVIEVGVSSGVSSAYLLQALERNRRGTLHSVDRPKRPPKHPSSAHRPASASWSLPPGRESGWAVPERLRPRWDLRIGDKRDVLPLLGQDLERIDLLVYDVPHWDRETRQEFLALDRRFPKGAVAIADHGPGGELCSALAAWADRRGSVPVGRKGLGLYGVRLGPRRGTGAK
jgi:hypothetical protein